MPWKSEIGLTELHALLGIGDRGRRGHQWRRPIARAAVCARGFSSSARDVVEALAFLAHERLGRHAAIIER